MHPGDWTAPEAGRYKTRNGTGSNCCTIWTWTPDIHAGVINGQRADLASRTCHEDKPFRPGFYIFPSGKEGCLGSERGVCDNPAIMHACQSMVKVSSLLIKAGLVDMGSVLELELGQMWRCGALKACIC